MPNAQESTTLVGVRTRALGKSAMSMLWRASLCISVSSPSVVWAGVAQAKCPDISQAAKYADEGLKKRESEDFSAAADAMEAAYRCMPRNDTSQHDQRWVYVVLYLDNVQEHQPADPQAAHEQQCRTQTLLLDYLESVAANDPSSHSTEAARRALAQIESELKAAPAASECVHLKMRRTDPTLPTANGGGDVMVTDADSPQPLPADPRRTRLLHRPLWLAGGLAGGLTLTASIVMGVALKHGADVEEQTAEAKQMGDLQRIRDELYPEGARANKLAITSASVGAALLITMVALLSTAGRRARAAKQRVTLQGLSIQGRF